MPVMMYSKFMECVLSKEVNLTGDTLKLMLCTSSYVPDQDTHKYKDVSVTNEVTGAGYTAGGEVLGSPALTYDAGTNKFTFDAADVVWTGVTITNARYAVLYDDTPASNKPLILCIDFGEDKPVSNNDFTVSWNASGIFSQTVPVAA